MEQRFIRLIDFVRREKISDICTLIDVIEEQGYEKTGINGVSDLIHVTKPFLPFLMAVFEANKENSHRN